MTIAIKRVYDPPAATDGTRILVDRLWPRGLSREQARIDHWLKEIAPSHELRRWYGHDPAKWDAFRDRYFEELNSQQARVAELRELARKVPVTLVFSSREPRINNAAALKEYLENLPGPE